MRIVRELRPRAPLPSADVAEILADVRGRGDEAVLDFTERFDRAELGPGELRVDAREVEGALGVLEPAGAGRVEDGGRRTSAPSPRRSCAKRPP